MPQHTYFRLQHIFSFNQMPKKIEGEIDGRARKNGEKTNIVALYGRGGSGESVHQLMRSRLITLIC